MVGSGVVGLTTAIALREAGYRVTIVTRERAAETTSAVAAAIWYPYRAEPRARVLAWSATTLERLAELSAIPASGVSMIDTIELLPEPTDDPWWCEAVPGFRHARQDELPPGYVDGYHVRVPLAEAPVHLSWLERRFLEAGGRVEPLEGGVDSLDELRRPGRLVVNCSGLGARELAADDEVFPVRGQVVRVQNPGLRRALIDERGPNALSYVVPRRGGDCVLGGTADEGAADLEVDPGIRERILERCASIEPRLRGARVVGEAVGLRPARREVRLEVEQASVSGAVIHNYGHGGAGFTLALGCAEEVVALARGLD